MLQFSQQRAVSYPTFPGNVQALSIPSSSLEPLQKPPPSPPPSPSPTLTTIMQHLESSASLGKPKRRQTLAACQHCRRRKSKCDGVRPTCDTCLNKATLCDYSVEQGKTQQQVSRGELNAYKTVVRVLRKASPTDTARILVHLKDNEDVNETLKFISETKDHMVVLQ